MRSELLHVSPYKNRLVQGEVPSGCPSQPPTTTTTDRELGVKAILCLRKAFCAPVSIYFAPKMCPGSGRKWVRACAMPCFSEHGHYRRSAETERGNLNKPRGPSWLFCAILLFHPLIFLFLLLSVLLLVFPRLAHAYLCLPLVFYSLHCFFLHAYFSISFLFFAIIPYSPLIFHLGLLFWFIWWAIV